MTTVLRDLERSLERCGWTVIAKEAGDGYDVAERWTVQRPGSPTVALDLQALDHDGECGSAEDAYAVRTLGGLSAYIAGGRGPRRQRMDTFVAALGRGAPPHG